MKPYNTPTNGHVDAKPEGQIHPYWNGDEWGTPTDWTALIGPDYRVVDPPSHHHEVYTGCQRPKWCRGVCSCAGTYNEVVTPVVRASSAAKYTDELIASRAPTADILEALVVEQDACEAMAGVYSNYINVIMQRIMFCAFRDSRMSDNA